ncbi:glycosyltransferase family 2 protein [Chryseobacterium sp. TY4]
MKLSFLIAAYNVEAFIEKCVLSCYDEALANNYEIIIVNDGSTDATLEKLNALSKSISNLKIINKANAGLGAARNTGLEHAQGDYVWMIDGDDFLEKNIVSEFLEKFSNSISDVYAFNFNITDVQGNVLSTKYPTKYIASILTGAEYYSSYFQNSYTWQYIFKRSIFKDNHLQFQERINMQDSEILPKIMYYANSVEYVDTTAYNYVQQDNSFTNTSNPAKRLQYFSSIVRVDQLLGQFSDSLTSEDNLIKTAIAKKRESLHGIVLNHLIFFKYDSKTFNDVIQLLKKENFYPLKAKNLGLKMNLVKNMLNINPVMAKALLNIVR